MGGYIGKPTILTVDDDPEVSAAIGRDLRDQYGADYRVVVAISGEQALGVLARLALREQPVALIVADERMPGMTGIALLEQARGHAPGAKSLLLTAYADTDVAIRAINDIGLDYYLLKPWDPPAERLFPVVDDLLTDWRRANPDETGDVRVVGHRWSLGSHDVKSFLARNHVPYRCWTSSGTRRPAGWSSSPAPRRATCHSCCSRTATRCARRRRCRSPGRCGCGPTPSSRCTTCASSAAARPASPRPCTPRPRA